MNLSFFSSLKFLFLHFNILNEFNAQRQTAKVQSSRNSYGTIELYY